MKRARFVAPAREEFLAEVATTIKFSLVRERASPLPSRKLLRALWLFRLPARHRTTTSAASFLRRFHSPLPIDQTRMALWSLRLRIIHGGPGIGEAEFPRASVDRKERCSRYGPQSG